MGIAWLKSQGVLLAIPKTVVWNALYMLSYNTFSFQRSISTFIRSKRVNYFHVTAFHIATTPSTPPHPQLSNSVYRPIYTRKEVTPWKPPKQLETIKVLLFKITISVLERVLRIFGRKGCEVTGRWRKLHNKTSIICRLRQISLQQCEVLEITNPHTFLAMGRYTYIPYRIWKL